MPLVVDAYNVLHTVGVLPKELAHIELAGLVGLLSNSRYRHDHTWLVCDGGPRKAGLQRPTGRITIQYAGPGREADDVIEHHIAEAPQPRQLKVVSSDRRLRKAARSRRCPVVDSSRFLEQLLSDYTNPPASSAAASKARRPQRLTAEQVRRWIIEFDLASSPLLEIPATSPSQVAPPPAPSDEPQHRPAKPRPAADGNYDHLLAEAIAMVQAFEQARPAITPAPTAPASVSSPGPSPEPVKPARPASSSAKRTTDDALDDAAMQAMFPDVKPLNQDDAP